ncbi:MAG: NF038122 family metalloprotease, partial [Acidobacteriota bacterium]|nr:NF038122 family metalloprotease [Acidobacteriota bacterium]
MRLRKSFLSSLLAFLLAFAALPLPAAAQDAAAPAAGKAGWDSEIFIITRNAQGESVCRLATPEERRQFARPVEARPDRVLIYPGARQPLLGSKDGEDGASPAALTTSTGAQLMPSAGLRIVLHGTTQLNSNAAARDAFIAAANKWEARISTRMTVVLDVDFGAQNFGRDWTSPSVLGATGTRLTSRRYSTVRNQLRIASPRAEETTLYNALPASSVPVELNGATTSASSVRLSVPTARALGLVPDITNPDAVPAQQGDARIGFNSAHDFDFDPSDGIAQGALDFDAVVVHEIGHALGFISDSGDGTATPLTVLDLFRFRPGTVSAGNLATFGTARRVMSEGGTQVYFNNRTNTLGSNELQLSTGGSDGEGGDGEQSSHWKDDRFGPFIGIMDPTLSSGRREQLNNNDLMAFDSFGYKIDGTMVSPPPPPPPAPPANDNFANAIVLQGASGTVAGDNFDATRQAGEPDPSHDPDGVVGQRSVWYFWTAPASGPVTMNTAGSDFDTTLGAYTGGAVNALAALAENDDVTPGEVRHSTITFNAAAGTTYRIMVNGWQSDTGTFKLNWTGPGAPPPPPPPPPPPTIQFASTAFNALERDGTAGLLITRTGDLTVSQTVSYQTSGGTATAGTDYNSAGGQITFGSGVSRAVLAITINDDAVAEANETVGVSLAAASASAVLGTVKTTTLVIRDDDSFPANSVRIAGEATRLAGEGAGRIDITVTRAGNLSQAASVNYRTADATATSLKDYNFASGTLNFAAGDASETFSVLITEDFHDEAEERFNVELSGPVGTALDPAQPSIQVIIQDDDPPGLTTNPSDNSGDFVEQHYGDFLNRVADAGGLQFWSSGIDTCGADAACRGRKRVDTSAAFFLSIEFQETGYLVYRMHKAAFGNVPGAPVPVRFQDFMRDTQEIGRGVVVGTPGWPQKLEANKQAFALAFVSRGRFKTAHPAELTPAQFIDALNANIGNVLTPAQYSALVNNLTANNTPAGRAAALRQVAETQALRDAEFRRAFV